MTARPTPDCLAYCHKKPQRFAAIRPCSSVGTFSTISPWMSSKKRSRFSGKARNCSNSTTVTNFGCIAMAHVFPVEEAICPIISALGSGNKHYVCLLENQDDNCNQTEANVCAALWSSVHQRHRRFGLW